jgi:tRNA pseudouridine synthase 10
MIGLCNHCNSRFGGKFPKGEPCHICGGLLEKLPELLDKAASAIDANWRTFALSTSIPREVLSKEEDAWDHSDGECIKSSLNAFISKELEKKSGKTYSPMDADGRISINLKTLEVSGSNEPVFLFGRYKKLIRGICQSRWICLTCSGRGCKKCNGKGKIYEESIEELIGDAVISESGGKYTLHASGREDVDVLNFAGRPFVLEVKNPSKIYPDLPAIAEKLNLGKKVEVASFTKVPPGFVKLVSDSHFPKTYRAWIESDSPLTKEDAQKLLSFDFVLEQRTPERVAHRRADKIRMRRAKIVSAKLEGSAIAVDVYADAGTYIKELIHSDSGRTKPSVSSFLEKQCRCAGLDVIGIEDDFLNLPLS